LKLFLDLIMSIKALNLELETRIQQGQDVSRNKQLKSALSQLVKNNLVDELSLDDIFSNTIKLKSMINEYESIILASGKKELRTPLTHARNLAIFYTNHFSFDTDGMSFSEAFKASFHRKFPNIYEGEITKKNRCLIKETHTTYRQVAADIVKTGAEIRPEAWPKSHAGAAALIVKYVHGYSNPTVNVPIARLEYFEDYFVVPRGTFINKLKSRINWNTHVDSKYKRKKLGKKNTKGEDMIPVVALSPSLQKYSDEYSAFKINAIQPKIIHTPNSFVGREEYLEVFEEGRRKNSSWTFNEGSKSCKSQIMFDQNLRAFMTYCVNELGINAEEITLADLTNIEILGEWKNYLLLQGWGASPATRVLNQLKRSSQPRGYLRLCGELGNRTKEKYFNDLDFIVAMESSWRTLLEENATQEHAPGENARFLLDMKPVQMLSAINKGIQWGLTYARNLINSPADDYLINAYNMVQAMTILHLSRIQPLRSENWAMLLFNDNEKDFNPKEGSLTWVKSRKCFRVFVPVPWLKNRAKQDIKPINLYFDTSFNSVIKNYLEYRAKYIDGVLNKGGLYNHNPRSLMPRKHRKADGVDPDNVFFEVGSTFSARFKQMTKVVFNHTQQESNQIGLNHHVTRKLAATWYLNMNPGDFTGLCLILGDSIEVVLKSYAEINDELALERVSKVILEQDIKFEL
jgi:hypothetical protein